jgi:hypothetical protein
VNTLIKTAKDKLWLSSAGIQAGASLSERESDMLSSREYLLIDIVLPILIFDGMLYKWEEGI